MGVIGELYYKDEFLCYTMEREWNNNQPFISCVPNGKYNLVKFDSVKYGWTYALNSPCHNVYANCDDIKNKTDRYACLFHSANTRDQLQGCIAPGMELGSIRNQWAVLRSRDAMTMLKEIWVNEPPGKLEIITVKM